MLQSYLDLDIEYLSTLLNKLKEKTLIEELFKGKLNRMNSDYRNAVNSYFLEKIDYQRNLHTSRSKLRFNFIPLLKD
jgi:hypothetical protein